MDGGDWISLAGVVIAGGSALWSALAARKAGKAQAMAEERARAATASAQRAADAAERSATAETDSAAAAERAAEVLEKQLAMAERRVNAAEGVPWRFQHQFGDTYELLNETATPKFGVVVTGETLRRIDQQVRAARIDGRSSLQFMALGAGGDSDALEVRWHRREDLSDEEQHWTGNKPPRPPRR